MEKLKNQNSNLQLNQSGAVLLHTDKAAQDQLDSLLLGSFAAQKIYGKDPATMGSVANVFHSVLADFPADKVLRAFNTHMQRSEEFPTPAAIVGLIKRNGRPPIKESEIIAIRKKDGALRTTEEWRMLRDWEEEQSSGWGDDPDPAAEERLRAENTRLRQEVAWLKAENEKAWRAARKNPAPLRPRAGPSEPPAWQKESPLDIARRTADFMRASGAKPEDIAQFERDAGIAEAPHV